MAENTRAPDAERALAELLSAADPETDAERAARAIRARMLSPAQLYEMHAEDIAQIKGISRAAAEAADVVDELCRYAEIEKLGANPRIMYYKEACACVRARYIGVHLEKCYLMCLDGAARLVECALISEGTIDHSQVYMRALAATALRTDARYAVLAHNHPGGGKAPSSSDADTTIYAMDALNSVKCALLDHIIVAGDAHVSMRMLGMPAESAWLSQLPGDGVIKNWRGKSNHGG